MAKDLTEAQKDKVSYLRDSLRLQDPQVETDPDYIFSDEELFRVLEIVTPAHNPRYTIDTLPDTEFYFVTLLAKKEIYYRLATSTAPLYPLSAEGAELEKNVRFDHYIKLVETVEKEYTESIERAERNQFGEVISMDTYIRGKQYAAQRALNLSNRPRINLKISGITDTSINVDWTKFESADFHNYALYVDKHPIIDEYEFSGWLSHEIVPKFYTDDIHRLKYRVKELTPNTEYYVCIVVTNTARVSGYSQQTIKTAPLVLEGIES